MKNKKYLLFSQVLSIAVFAMSYIYLFLLFLSEGYNSSFIDLDNTMLIIFITVGLITLVLIKQSSKMYLPSFILCIITYITLIISYLNDSMAMVTTEIYGQPDKKLIIPVAIMGIITSLLVNKSTKKSKMISIYLISFSMIVIGMYVYFLL